MGVHPHCEYLGLLRDAGGMHIKTFKMVPPYSRVIVYALTHGQRVKITFKTANLGLWTPSFNVWSRSSERYAQGLKATLRYAQGMKATLQLSSGCG